jgi:hypothetical protein
MREMNLANLRARLRERLMAGARAETELGAEAQAGVDSEAQAEARAQADAAAQERALANAEAGGGGGGSDDAMTQLQTGYTLTETCFDVWNEIKVSMKARYFVSWKRYVNVMNDVLDRLQGAMWDANIVCKCLGRCELNRFEDLGLMEACRYEQSDQTMMEYIFKDEGAIKPVGKT